MKYKSFSEIFRKYVQRHNVVDLMPVEELNSAGIFVVIPAFLEREYIERCLLSLIEADGIATKVCVIVVVNASEDASSEIIKEQEELFQQVVEFSLNNSSSQLIITPLKVFNVKKKHFGVGYARKAGMDQAVLQLYNSNRLNAVIVSLDADSIVAPNYFNEIERYFNDDDNMGCSIRFEHPLEGDLNPGVYEAIAQYELHMRYYKFALLQTGFPYAFHTVGSSFALKASQYVRAGGMPRKQAGEDFYFIQKVVQMGGYGELNTTCVYPSARSSTRVPFGTGPSVRKMVEDKSEYTTYNLVAFHYLKKFFETRMSLYGVSQEEFNIYVDTLPEILKDFLIRDNFFDDIVNLSNNCASQEVFDRRFFELFNAFKVVKYLNYVHDNTLKKVPVTKAAMQLLDEMNLEIPEFTNAKKLLEIFREIDG